MIHFWYLQLLPNSVGNPFSYQEVRVPTYVFVSTVPQDEKDKYSIRICPVPFPLISTLTHVTNVLNASIDTSSTSPLKTLIRNNKRMKSLTKSDLILQWLNSHFIIFNRILIIYFSDSSTICLSVLSILSILYVSIRIRGNHLSEVLCLSRNPRYSYVETSVELWHFFTASKIHILQEKKLPNAFPRQELLKMQLGNEPAIPSIRK